MLIVGFSTGALALSDFHAGIALNVAHGLTAVELSALREAEVDGLVSALPTLDLSPFDYISFHAPSSLNQMTETELVDRLQEVSPYVSGIIVHPNIIKTPSLWMALGSSLLLENMDQRKPVCRTAMEMLPYFDALPAARLCFDIGHARQVDPTMTVSFEILEAFGDRIGEIHISEVNSACRHVALSAASVLSFQRVANLIPEGTPIIIESMIAADFIDREVEMAISSFACQRDREMVS